MIMDMLSPKRPETCLVIGAGFTGLTAARALRERGVLPIVLEKSAAPGGRIQTESFDGGVFDHGAQFLTARDHRVQQIIDPWVREGLAREWSRGFIGANGVRPNDRYPRYRGTRGMASFVKRAAEGIDIRCNARVKALSWRGGFWEAEMADGTDHAAPAAILTCPIPQALGLIKRGNYELPEIPASRLERVTYDPCIAVLATCKTRPKLPEPGAIHLSGEPLRFIADNHRKGISPGAFAVTIHCGPLFSREHLESEDGVIIEKALEAAAPILKTEIRSATVRRWPLSQAVNPIREECLVAVEDPMLVFAGDGFASGNVEAALLSGHVAALAVAAERKMKILSLLGL